MRFIPAILALAMRSAQDGEQASLPIETQIHSDSITSLDDLQIAIKGIFYKHNSKETRRVKFTEILRRTALGRLEVGKYESWDPLVSYTRNIIYTDHENFDLLLLCWNPGKASRVHDHPGDGCFIKVIDGSIKETIYDVSKDMAEYRSEHIRNSGDVCYINNTLGVHRIANPSQTGGAVTLHLYTPPIKDFSVWDECNIKESIVFDNDMQKIDMAQQH